MTLGGAAWKPLGVSAHDLNLARTLCSGQAFTWRTSPSQPDEFSAALLGGRAIVSLKQNLEHIFYRISTDGTAAASEADALDARVKQYLHDYFQLDVSVSDLYKVWSSRDDNFQRRAASLGGVRLLRQDPVENLLTFICTSNNNIARITQMISKLCEAFGKNAGFLPDQPQYPFYAFPTIASLTVPDVDRRLRELGFGYRAAFVVQSARKLEEKGGESYLMGLRKLDYAAAKKELLEFPGVGPKVADCVLLMSLDQSGAIPVDTHVWQIAKRDYSLQPTSTKTLTAKTYDLIGDRLREIFGERAGWAHSVLFAAEVLAETKGAKAKTKNTRTKGSETQSTRGRGRRRLWPSPKRRRRWHPKGRQSDRKHERRRRH
ncbi:N-glycosylase/DNA lyase-like protein [Zopfochytrium polystomum]|nr:N-glycosylase/DNA lyase-like protein [Zopfochytrium polystomum]